NSDGLAQLAPHFCVAGRIVLCEKMPGKISPQQSIHGGPSSMLAPHHGVVDSFCGESIDETRSVPPQPYPVTGNAKRRSRQREAIRMEVRALGGALDDS